MENNQTMDHKLIKKILLERTNREGFPTQQEIADFLAKYYPEESKDEKLFHDNWGLFSKKPNGIVKRILLCTTPTRALVQYCQENKYDLLISHHDFLFNTPGVPQIIYHSSMDESARGHNTYFVKKMGLHNKRELHKVVVGGDLYKPLTLDQFKEHLIKRGFEINGLVWESPQADNRIESVLYCSGMGGMLLGPNHIIDISKVPADVYVTGELTSDPAKTSTQFKYIIELGHTSSEKPLFKWIKNMLRNRWKNVEVDLASKEMDIWGDDTYKAKMDKNKQWDLDWEKRRAEYERDFGKTGGRSGWGNRDDEPVFQDDFWGNGNFGGETEDDFWGNGNFGGETEDDFWGNGNFGGETESEHPLIQFLFDNGANGDIIEDVGWMLQDYYSANDDAKPQMLEQILVVLDGYDPDMANNVRQEVEHFFPEGF